MVDGVFMLADGRRGALEVTTLGDADAIELERLTSEPLGPFPFLRWAWHVTVPADYRVNELEKLPVLLSECERVGVLSPDEAESSWPRRLPNRLGWLVSRGVRAFAFPETNRPGMIDVFPAQLGGGGAVPDNANNLSSWLESALMSEGIVRHVAKLLAHPADLRHLFLRV